MSGWFGIWNDWAFSSGLRISHMLHTYFFTGFWKTWEVAFVPKTLISCCCLKNAQIIDVGVGQFSKIHIPSMFNLKWACIKSKPVIFCPAGICGPAYHLLWAGMAKSPRWDPPSCLSTCVGRYIPTAVFRAEYFIRDLNIACCPSTRETSLLRCSDCDACIALSHGKVHSNTAIPPGAGILKYRKTKQHIYLYNFWSVLAFGLSRWVLGVRMG